VERSSPSPRGAMSGRPFNATSTARDSLMPLLEVEHLANNNYDEGASVAHTWCTCFVMSASRSRRAKAWASLASQDVGRRRWPDSSYVSSH